MVLRLAPRWCPTPPRHAMQEIRDGSAYVAEALDAGKIRLVGAMYDVGTGKVTFVEH